MSIHKQGLTRKFALLLIVTMILQLAAVNAVLASSPGTEKRITDNKVHDFAPAIYGDNIVWINVYNGKPQVFRYSIEKGKIYSITDDDISKYCPSVYQDTFVWDAKDGEVNNIYMYKIGSAGPVKINTGSPESNKIEPAIYGDRIVYQDDRNGKWDIYMYENGAVTRVTDDVYDQVLPDIDNERIVWQDNRNGQWDIFMYDLKDKKEKRITNKSGYYPAISGDYVVWEDYRNTKNNGDIYMYNLKTGLETAVATGINEQYDPEICGDRIVWEEKDPSGQWDVYMYEISTGQTTRITNNADDQYFPVVYGDTIVWTDDRNVNEEIYMLVLDRGSNSGGGGGGGSSGSLNIPGVAGPTEGPFIDVPGDYWAVDEIVYLSTYGITKGYPDETFRPLYPVTRAELAVFMGKVLGLDTSNVGSVQQYTDVPVNHWAFNAIEAATKADIMIGYNNGKFEPEAPVVREEMVQVLIKSLRYEKIPVTIVSPGILDKFTDKDKIPWWAKDAAEEAVSLGIVHGINENIFGAGLIVSRDQGAVMIVKTIKIFKK